MNVANVTKQMLINAKSVGIVMPIIVRRIKECDWTESRQTLLNDVKERISNFYYFGFIEMGLGGSNTYLA